MTALQDPLIEVIEALASEVLHPQAWSICTGKGWYFSQRTNSKPSPPCWQMDLDGVPVFEAIWQSAKARCEALAGRELRVLRQYASTQPHSAGESSGSFTLIYYPMLEWSPEWQGETVFYKMGGEIALSATPQPNSAIFFATSVAHDGAAPTRDSPMPCVTVVFSLEPAESGTASANIFELEREGPRRVYAIRASSTHISALVENRLTQLGGALRAPGIRPGKIPRAVLRSRYGASARAESIRRIGNQAVDRFSTVGNDVPGSLELISGAQSGDVEFRLALTHLPDLPEIGCEAWEFERLTIPDAGIEEAAPSVGDMPLLFNQHLHQQVLDRLDAAWAFPVAPGFVAREMESIRGTAPYIRADLREVAARRVRLRASVRELARRHHIGTAEDTTTLEDQVIEWLISRAHVTERAATPEEQRALTTTDEA